MKKLKVICAIALCVAFIEGAVIISGAIMPKREVAANEKVTQAMNEKEAVDLLQVTDLIPPVVLEEKDAEPVVTQAPEVEAPVETVAPVEVQQEAPAATVIPKEAPVETVAPVEVQQEAPVATVTPQDTYTQPDYVQGSCPFLDANGDGFCDYGDVHCHNGAHMDANGDGFCDYGDHYCMQGYGGNGGVCDNYNTVHSTHHSYGNNGASTSGSSSNSTSGNMSNHNSYGGHHSSGHHSSRHH